MNCCRFNNNCCCVDRCCVSPIPGPPGPIGPRGATGPTGPTGPAGPPAPSLNTFGSFYNPNTQILTTGTPVALTNTITASNVTLINNSVIVGSIGTYLIAYGVNVVSGVNAGDNIFIAVNGVAVAGTERQISSLAQTSSSTIVQLTAGSVVTLMPTANGLSVLASGSPSAYLSITRIS